MVPAKRLVRVVLPLGVLALLAGVAGYLLLGDKFGPVGSSGVYRSAQLSPEALERYLKQYQIATLFNLRGHNPEKPWYREERAVLRRLGVTGRDFPLNARILPEFRLLQSLVNALDQAERPLLVHCQHGNDRAGLAAILVQLLTPGVSLEAAWAEVSVWRGVLYPDTVGRQFLRQYTGWLESRGQLHSVAQLRRFVEQGYRDADDNLQVVLDRINGEPIHNRDETTVSVAAGEPLEMVGWAFDPLVGGPLATIEVWFGDQPLGQAEGGVRRQDVARTYGDPRMVPSGWRLALPVAPTLHGCAPIYLSLTRTDGSVRRPRPQGRLCFE